MGQFISMLSPGGLVIDTECSGSKDRLDSSLATSAIELSSFQDLNHEDTERQSEDRSNDRDQDVRH